MKDKAPGRAKDNRERTSREEWGDAREMGERVQAHLEGGLDAFLLDAACGDDEHFACAASGVAVWCRW